MKITALTGLVLLGLMRFTFASPADDNAAVTKQIRESLTQWTQAANRGDWKTALQLWAPDLVGWVGSDTVVVYAQEAKMAAHPTLSDTVYTLVKINEVMVDGSLAVVRDTWNRRITQPDGHKALFRVRRYEIWRRQPDRQWKISRYIENPPTATQEVPARVGGLVPIDAAARSG